MPKLPDREAVAAVIIRDDGRYLMIKRAAGIAAAGYWTTVTGKPEAGEPLASALEREVLEEVGLEARAGRELYRCPTHDHRWMLVWLEASLATGDGHSPLRLLASEVERARWVTASEAVDLEPIFADTRRFFEARALLESEGQG